MKPNFASRALLCGATLLAVTAVAAPAPAQSPSATPSVAASPCLSQQPATRPDAKQHNRWRGPCYLADAEKNEESSENDGVSRKATQRRLDKIEMLSRLGAQADETHQLPWEEADQYGRSTSLEQTSQGGPGNWALHRNPLYHAADQVPRIEAEIPAVPEPANAAMWAAGLVLLAGLAAVRRR